MTSRPGATLLELIITVGLLGILSAITVLTIRRMDPVDPADPKVIVRDSINESIKSGRTIRVQMIDSGTAVSAIVFPDGSVVADSVIAPERLTGVYSDAKK